MDKHHMVTFINTQRNRIAELENKLPKWISCSERLPKVGDIVLITALDFVSTAWLSTDGDWLSYDLGEKLCERKPWKEECDEVN